MIRPAAWIVVILCASASAAHAQITYPPCPPDNEYVSDTAKLLSEREAADIQSTCEKLRREQGVPLVVVTIPSMESCGIKTTTIERFAQQVFDYYGDTRKDWRKGIILLVSSGDRKARIETGSWWGSTFNGAARSIMSNTLVPPFKRGLYGAGLVGGTTAIAEAVPSALSSAGTPSTPSSSTPPGPRTTRTTTTTTTTRHHQDNVYHSYNSGPDEFGYVVIGAIVVIGTLVLIAIIAGLAHTVSPWTGGAWSGPSYSYGPYYGGFWGGGYWYRPWSWGGGGWWDSGSSYSSTDVSTTTTVTTTPDDSSSGSSSSWGDSSSGSSGDSSGSSDSGFSDGGGATGDF